MNKLMRVIKERRNCTVIGAKMFYVASLMCLYSVSL